MARRHADAQIGAASHRDHRKPLSGGETKNFRDLRRRIGLQNRGRAAAIDFAGSERSCVRDDAAGTDKVRETRGERGRKLAHASPAGGYRERLQARLAAAFAEGQDLVGIEHVRGIEDGADLAASSPNPIR